MEQETSNILLKQLTQFENGLLNARAKFRTDLRNLRGYLIIGSISSIFIILHYLNTLLLPTWLLVTLWILATLFLLAAAGTDPSKSKLEVDKIETIRKIYLGFPANTADKPEYFDSLVKINVENLAAYYSLAKTHTAQSFRVSLIISVIGFVFIVLGLVIGFRYNEKVIGYIASGAGILTEFISALLFYLYNKTVRQLKEYHDSLIDVQNVLLSFKLIESTADEKSKAEMVTKMLEYLVQKK